MIQLPNGTWCLTHSTLFTSNGTLEGRSSQDTYEYKLAGNTARARNASTPKMRRRRRLRRAVSRSWRRCSTKARAAAAGRESAGTGGVLTPGPASDRLGSSIRFMSPGSIEEDKTNTMVRVRPASRPHATAQRLENWLRFGRDWQPLF